MSIRRIVLEVDTEKLDQRLAQNGGGEDIFAVGNLLFGTSELPDCVEERQLLGITVISQETIR